MALTGQRVIHDLRGVALRPPAAAGGALLRPQPGGPAHDPRPQRRGGGERGVHQRPLRDRGRRGHAGRRRGRHAVDRLAAGPGDLRHRARAVRGRRLLPHPRPRRLSRGAPPAGPAQRLPAGVAAGHGRDPALRPRGARAAELRAAERGLPAGAVRLDRLRGLALRRGGGAGLRGAGAAALVRRRPHPGRRADLRRAGRLHPVHEPLLPAHPRPRRQVHGDAVGDGLGRAHLRAARSAAGHRGAAGPAGAGHRAPAGAAFEGVWFAYEGERWVLADCPFSVAPGEHVALVGTTGEGKSTCVRLLNRT